MMALSLHDLDLESAFNWPAFLTFLTALLLVEECVVIKNTSSQGVNLEGCIFQDSDGKNSCKPFGDYTVGPNSLIVFWTCPGRVEWPSGRG